MIIPHVNTMEYLDLTADMVLLPPRFIARESRLVLVPKNV